MLVMRAFLALIWVVLAVPSITAQEASIDVDQFRLETILGAQAKAAVGSAAPSGQNVRVACRRQTIWGRYLFSSCPHTD